MSYTWQNRIDNRAKFLAALRSGEFIKGTTKSNSKGNPIFENNNKEGYCACAIALELFPANNLEYRRALDIGAKQCRLIQKWNDEEDSTFPEIANRIEKFLFEDRYKLSKEDHEYSKTMYDDLE